MKTLEVSSPEAGVTGSTEPAELSILGAGGMMAGELLRLAAQHRFVRVRHAITRRGGESLEDVHPHLTTGAASPCLSLDAFVAEVRANGLGSSSWLVLALPHGEAAGSWKALREELGGLLEGVSVIDLSADYRLQDLAAYERWYGKPHDDTGELASFVYGLPELFTVSPGATRIAAPGCFATALQLACLPAARAGFLSCDQPWILHAATGSSGSGAKPRPLTHHPHRHANFHAYPSDGHRHEAELAQALTPLGVEPTITFLPHSAPWARGIHLSAVLPLSSRDATFTREDALELFQTSYGASPFVRVVQGNPDLRTVIGSNVACLGVRVRDGALVVEVTLDNLVKGGSGQALQCLNLALGLPETEGLPTMGMGTL